jgi:hypothetical protein
MSVGRAGRGPSGRRTKLAASATEPPTPKSRGLLIAMPRTILLLVGAATLALGLHMTGLQTTARAGHPHHWYTHYDRAAHWANSTQRWHHVYSHTQFGQPIALIVPPTANMHTNYSWGVARTRMSPTNHQFARPVPAPGGGGMWYPAPAWPSDTAQLGIYHVRGPW